MAIAAFVVALLLPTTGQFVGIALPALVGECLLHWGLRRWPRVALLVGALLAWFAVTVIAFAALLCGLGDEVTRACDRATDAAVPVTWCFGAITVALTALAIAWPRRRALRYALWSTPTLMVGTFAVIAFA